MAKMSFENHIMKQFDDELEEIRTRLMEMGGKVEQQLQNAILAISNADSQLAEQVISEDQSVDAMEIDIDEACILIIARRQPAASDLRLVMMVTKAVNDLERIGDEARKIANHAIILSEESETSAGYPEVRRHTQWALNTTGRWSLSQACFRIGSHRTVSGLHTYGRS